MERSYIPESYTPKLNLYDTQKAIGLLKRLFEDTLCGELNLRRVSAPLFVEASTGLNDDLNGFERAVSFDSPSAGKDAQVVHSLAKWKRLALYRYQFLAGEGLYTDMNAIRRDEDLDNLHSVYVDQWDWEKVIAPRDRNENYLKATVDNTDVFSNVVSCACGLGDMDYAPLCALAKEHNVPMTLENTNPGNAVAAREHLEKIGASL